MVLRQPNGHPALSGFHDFIRSQKTLSKGCRGMCGDLSVPFIPEKKLDAYFEQHLTEILKAVYPDKDPGNLPNPTVIRHSFVKTFGILLCIECGHDIEYFMRYDHALADSQLPLDSQPQKWPQFHAQDVFKRFKEMQWLFCAANFGLDTDIEYDKERILPIIAKEQLGEGGSAIAHKVELEDGYNQLFREESYSSNSRTNIVVIKTYMTRDAEKYFVAEHKAFKRLHRGKRWAKNIVGFYNAFQHGDHFNIVLEYANRGTLQHIIDYMSPPTKASDIHTFWSGLLDVANGLMTIHGATTNDTGEEIQIMLGWHQDLTPSNIFVFHTEGEPKYKFCFKIGDLGTSHFRKYNRSGQVIKDTATPGTHTYGAPECSLSDLKIRTSAQDVDQSIDIWSLGCIYSVIATWIANDKYMVYEYADQRRTQYNELTPFSGRDCFHDGDKVLPIVMEHHQNMKSDLRRSDQTTAPVLDDLVKKMLFKANGRPSARNICAWSHEIIQNSEQTLKQQKLEAIETSRKPRRRATSIKEEEQDSNADITIHSPSSYDPRSGGSLHAHREGRKPRALHSMYGSDARKGVASVDDDENKTTSPTFISWSDTSDVSPSPSTPSQTSAITQTPRELLQDRPISDGSAVSSLNMNPKVQMRQIGPKESHTSSDYRRSQTYPSKSSQPLQQMPEPQLTTVPSYNQYSSTLQDTMPRMDLSEALLWKRANQTKRLNQQVLHPLLNREQVFLIDNSLTMRDYRGEVRDVLEFLSYVTSDYDPNGLDVYFLNSHNALKARKCRNSDEAVKAFDSVTSFGHADMGQRFSVIIEDYQAQFDETHRVRRLFNKSQPSKGPRKLSLYVLTDGAFLEQCDLESTISGLVGHMRERKYPESQVGIQFIRFGEHKEGGVRLQQLDDDLKAKIGW
ncbi:MAG: hypothetical protein Q9214_003179 [Letrouitia sp. 1 TL-2023]